MLLDPEGRQKKANIEISILAPGEAIGEIAVFARYICPRLRVTPSKKATLRLERLSWTHPR